MYRQKKYMPLKLGNYGYYRYQFEIVNTLGQISFIYCKKSKTLKFLVLRNIKDLYLKTHVR